MNNNNRQVLRNRFAVMLFISICASFSIIFSYIQPCELSLEGDAAQSLSTKSDDDLPNLAYTYRCDQNRCVKTLVARNSSRTSLEMCRMLCGTPDVIWPRPKSLKINTKSSELIPINMKQVSVDLHNIPEDGRDMASKAFDIFLDRLEQEIVDDEEGGDNYQQETELQVILNYSSNVNRLTLNVDESYTLSIQKSSDLLVTARVAGDNFFGVRHGLETLLQLIQFDRINHQLKVFTDIEISDGPRFPYRGLMVDTARNWCPIEKLKKIIDGMSMSKLNILHLHLTDAASFPVELPSLPLFAQFGAYGRQMIYAYDSVRELIEYGKVRGVRVLLEVDAPSHIDAGWNVHEDLVICQDVDPPLGGHLNIDNEQGLQILEKIYSDLLQLMDQNDLFHIGADEVNFDCWRRTKKGQQSSDLMAVWANFTNAMLEKVMQANNGHYPDNIIMWSSPLTNSQYLSALKTSESSNLTVQFWLGSPLNVLRNGNRIIYSTVDNWYLDCGFGSWKSDKFEGVCDPFRSWHKFYKYRPWQQYAPQYAEQTVGGEVCLWSEEVDFNSLESRVWPRAAAFAERIWSDPTNYDMKTVGSRLDSFRDRLIRGGIQAAAMWPRWCSQNPQTC